MSTRGRAPGVDFDEVLLGGLAPDGGLYLPAAWPRIGAGDWAALAKLSYAELAARVTLPFLDGSVPPDDYARLAADAYRDFDAPEVAPLVALDATKGEHLLELFHGPTFSFKDYALQPVGRLFDRALRRRGRRATVLVATSGDTGSAAIAACVGRAAIDIVVLYPEGRISEVQRRQMTGVDAPNVHVRAVAGTFDDCQALVKSMFADRSLRAEAGLAAMNSINWARIQAQIVYYIRAYLALGAPKSIAFAVPTGNFGNVYAAYAARKMGLPISQLVVGSNANDILTRFFETGAMATRDVVPTLAPSMDIQVSSNFERYLFDLLDGDSAATARTMERFRAEGRFDLDKDRLSRARALFAGYRLLDENVLHAIRRIHDETGRLVDPHTAIGIAAARAKRADASVPMVCVATAHPAKFPNGMKAAFAPEEPPLDTPPALAHALARPESRAPVLANDPAQAKEFVRSIAKVAA